ncbi:MAG: hypothetical protein P4M09_21505 [Devosia sp.]|nr:hypothetical protein [Devosia sp.]
MKIQMRLWALAGLLALGTAAPALAQDVPAETSKSLWCASAFALVEPQARAEGAAATAKNDSASAQADIAAADNFKKYAGMLQDMSTASLKKAGFTDDQIKTQTTAFAEKVNKELTGGGAAEFSVIECTKLVDPEAAAMNARSTVSTPDAATPTPANGSTAPAPATGATTPAPASN